MKAVKLVRLPNDLIEKVYFTNTPNIDDQVRSALKDRYGLHFSGIEEIELRSKDSGIVVWRSDIRERFTQVFQVCEVLPGTSI